MWLFETFTRPLFHSDFVAASSWVPISFGCIHIGANRHSSLPDFQKYLYRKSLCKCHVTLIWKHYPCSGSGRIQYLGHKTRRREFRRTVLRSPLLQIATLQRLTSVTHSHFRPCNPWSWYSSCGSVHQCTVYVRLYGCTVLQLPALTLMCTT